MVWKKDPLGCGPTRLTNEWFNSLQDQIESNRRVARTFASGVVWGCTPTFSDGTADEPAVIGISQGAVLVGGIYYEVVAKELEIVDLPPSHPGLAGGNYVWAFVRFKTVVVDGQTEELEPELVYDYGLSTAFAWPKTSNGFHDLPILALGQIDSTDLFKWNLEFQRDLRHFVREKPNGAAIVVGDLNAGADFDGLQEALDYLASCDEGGNQVPRRVVVTKALAPEKPYLIRCHGVSIEGVLNEVGPPAVDADEKRVTITWSYTAEKGKPEAGAAIDVAGFQDVSISNLHFIRADAEVWCALHNPGRGFRLAGCVFGNDPSDYGAEDDAPEAMMAVVVNFTGGVTQVRLEDNRAYVLKRGLIGVTGMEDVDGGSFATTGYLANSTVARNNVSTAGLVIPTAEDGNPVRCWWIAGRPLPESEDWSWKDPKKYFYAIDLGVSEGFCVGNIVRDNVVDHCFNGIRAGALSSVRSNVITQCAHFGVMVTVNGTVPEIPEVDADYDPVGATEVVGNYIEMSRFHGVPWWRAGVRLEATTCVVTGNTVVVGQSKGCGVVHGPLVLSEIDSLKAHFGTLRDGNHLVSGNNIVMNPVKPDGTIDHGLAVTRGGVGVLLLSVDNRVTDNGIFHARTGVVVTAHNVVADNVITPTVVAVLAWASNTITGNSIGWFAHTAPGLPWELAIEGVTGAIMLSIANTCNGNSIIAGADNPDDADAPAAIHVADWGTALFGRAWGDYFDESLWKATTDPRALHLVGARSGGNIISKHVIELSNPNGAAGEGSAYFNLDGIVLNGDPDGNTVTGTTITRGYRGIVARTGSAVITGCSTYLTRDLCLLLDDAASSDVSGSIFYTDTGQPARIEATSTDTTLNDCLVVQGSKGVDRYNRTPPPEAAAAVAAAAASTAPLRLNVEAFRPVCIEQRADRVAINDCAIINYSNAGIQWNGSFGECGGCWFFTRDPDHGNDDTVVSNLKAETPYPRFPAIRFATRPVSIRKTTDDKTAYFPNAATGGNLVHGAHMLNCSLLAKSSATIAPSSESVAVAAISVELPTVDCSPIEWSNDYWMYDAAEDPASFTKLNPHPPEYNTDLDRWTNRICVESCYYWDVHRYTSSVAIE